jgi:hypothetical protein
MAMEQPLHGVQDIDVVVQHEHRVSDTTGNF